MSVTDFFEKFARSIAQYSGRPVTFFVAFMVVVVWAFTGPIFGFSDTWQLVINTGTTIITFLMVFLVQSAQNRDSKALQLKLDELIFKMGPADNTMLEIQDLTESELDDLIKKYKEVRDQHINGNGHSKGKANHRDMQDKINSINKNVARQKQARSKKTEKNGRN